MIDRSQPAEDQTLEDWWQSLERWSKDDNGYTIPNRGLCETPSADDIAKRPVWDVRPAAPQEIKAAKL